VTNGWRAAATVVAALVSSALIAVTLAACHTATAESGAPPATSTSMSPAPSTAPAPSASTAPTPRPAAMAGGACLLLDFDVIKRDLGTAFNVAASADTSGTFTCVVQDSTRPRPIMVVAITATDLTTTEFKSDAQPAGAKPVTKLGKIGYEIVHSAAGSAGPVVEIGWLSGNDRLITIRYTCAAGTPSAAVKDLASRIATLARAVDITTN
jgi:hypothetical protein